MANDEDKDIEEGDTEAEQIKKLQKQIKKLQEEGQKLTQPLLEDQAIVRTLEKIIAESEPKTD